MTPLRFAFPLLLAMASCTYKFGFHLGGEIPEAGYQPDTIYVNECMLAPAESVVPGLSPRPGYAWEGGYWVFRDETWHWVPGRWIPDPNLILPCTLGWNLGYGS